MGLTALAVPRRSLSPPVEEASSSSALAGSALVVVVVLVVVDWVMGVAVGPDSGTAISVADMLVMNETLLVIG
jgi:hypothetical protein